MSVLSDMDEIITTALEELHELAEDNDLTDDDMHDLLVENYHENLAFYYRQCDFE